MDNEKLKSLVKNEIASKAGSVLNKTSDWAKITRKSNNIIAQSSNLSIDRPGDRIAEILGFQIGMFDTVGGHDLGPQVNWGGRSAFWVHQSFYHYDGTDTMSETNIRAAARLAKTGGSVPFSSPDPFILQPDSFLVLDLEGAFQTISASSLAEIINWAKDEEPTVKVGVYSWVYGPPSNNDMWANPSQELIDAFDADILSKAAAFNAMDAVVNTDYLLGPSAEQRDLDTFTNINSRFRICYPNLALVDFIWGIYHTSFGNPYPTYITQPWLDTYIETCRNIMDAVLVWGNYESNQYLIARLLDYQDNNPMALKKNDNIPTNWFSTPIYKG